MPVAIKLQSIDMKCKFASIYIIFITHDDQSL